MEMNLIYKEAHNARWTGLDLDERIGIASLAACEAEADHDPAKGALSTLVVTYIRNAFRSEKARINTRMKYNGIQGSTLEPSQIPPADVPDPEKQAVFRDSIAKLPADSRLLVKMALHTPKAAIQVRGGNVLSVIKQMCKDNRGWTEYRYQRAASAIRGVL